MKDSEVKAATQKKLNIIWGKKNYKRRINSVAEISRKYFVDDKFELLGSLKINGVVLGDNFDFILALRDVARESDFDWVGEVGARQEREINQRMVSLLEGVLRLVPILQPSELKRLIEEILTVQKTPQPRRLKRDTTQAGVVNDGTSS